LSTLIQNRKGDDENKKNNGKKKQDYRFMDIFPYKIQESHFKLIGQLNNNKYKYNLNPLSNPQNIYRIP